MSDKDAYNKLIDNLESQISELKKEKDNLYGLVRDCFKALAAKESPMYYQDTREKEQSSPGQIKQEEIRKMQSKMFNEYVNQVEHSDFFNSPEDLEKLLHNMDADDILSKVAPLAMDSPESLHNNEES